MNRSYSLTLLTAGLVLLCTLGFKPSHTSPSSQSTSEAKNMLYYWYTWPDDTYHSHTSLGAEEDYWWYALGGVLVDTNPIGGTLIVRGYQNNSYPHFQLPSAYLFAHYTE